MITIDNGKRVTVRLGERDFQGGLVKRPILIGGPDEERWHLALIEAVPIGAGAILDIDGTSYEVESAQPGKHNASMTLLTLKAVGS